MTPVQRMALRPTREQRQAIYLASREARFQRMMLAWSSQLRDLFHPITLSDGSVWRNGHWERPAR